MNKKAFKSAAKWIWMTAVLVFVIFYTIKKKDLITDTFSMLPIEAVLGAMALVLAAKICLVTNMRIATSHFKIMLKWQDCYCIYNLTQLAKYIPGSIWHFVGRITILLERGISMQDIRDSLLAEHLWVIASAITLAGLLVLTSIQNFFEAELAYSISYFSTWILVALILFACITVLSLLFNQKLLRWLMRLLPPPVALPNLLLIWIFLGASLWVTLHPFTSSMPSMGYIIGVYCFAYASGFLVPFAPAGLGIREAVLTFTLTPFMGADVAVLLAAVNRIIYFVIEIMVVFLCLGKKK